MSVCSVGADWWLTKILALLHDPPWKPWVVCGKPGRLLASSQPQVGREREGKWCIKGDEFCVRREDLKKLADMCESKEIKAHEADARALLLYIAAAIEGAGRSEAASKLREEALKRASDSPLWRIVESADRLAATFDRWVAEYIEGGRGGTSAKRSRACEKFVSEGVLVNIINPKLRYVSCKQVDPSSIIENYLAGLLRLVQRAAGSGNSIEDVLRRVYFALYLGLEPLWYASGGTPPVADTRYPNHTVFDHVYATVQVVNIVASAASGALSPSSIGGYVVLVDVPGVQRFVAAARRVRDLWMNSWLVSATAYSAVSKLVSQLGPDIMVKPSPSLNPFVAYHLAVEAFGNNLFSELKGILEALGLECSDNKVASCWPRQPLMPGQVKLILPSIDVLSCLLGSVGSMSTGGSGSGFNGCNTVISHIENEVNSAWEELAEEIIGEIEKRKSKLEPPDVINVIKEVVREPPLRIRVACEELGGAATRLKEVLEEIRVKIGEISGKARLREKDLLEELKRKLIYLLIVAEMPRTVDDEPSVEELTPLVRSASKVFEYTSRAYREGRRWRHCSVCSSPLAVRVTGGGPFDEGETLCPYCLAKRLVATRPQLLGKAVSSLILRNANVKVGISGLPVVLRTGDVATAYVQDFYGGNCRHRVPKLFGEALRRAGWSSERCEVEEGEGEVEPRYLLIVKGDGDSMGSGIFRGVLGIKYAKYVKLVASAAGVDLPTWMPELLGVAEDAARQLLGVAQEKGVVLATPAYIMAASRALMATAIQDARIVEALGGVLIYAGGDDIAALLPAYAPQPGRNVVEKIVEEVLPEYNMRRASSTVKAAADSAKARVTAAYAWPGAIAVALLRANYWGLLSGYAGFHSLPVLLEDSRGSIRGSIVVPAVTVYGRSFGVVVMHYRDHLLTGYLSAAELEEAKDYLEIRKIGGNDLLRKDMLVVGYGRLGYYLRRIATVEPHVTAVTRFSLVSGDPELGGGVEAAHRAVEGYRELIRGRGLDEVAERAVLAPYLAVVGVLAAVEGGVASVSLLHDAAEDFDTATRAIEDHGVRGAEAAEALLRRVVRRNVDSRALSAPLWGALAKYSSYIVHSSGVPLGVLSFEEVDLAAKFHSARR